MRLTIACVGLLLCAGCAGGLFPTQYSAYSDAELMTLLAEKYYAFSQAAATGDPDLTDQAMDEFFDVYEEAMRRPSFGGDATSADVQAMRNYYQFMMGYMRAAQSQQSRTFQEIPSEDASSDQALIGTWDLVSQNGHTLSPDVYVRWTFAPTTITTTCDLVPFQAARFRVWCRGCIARSRCRFLHDK